MTLTGLKSPGKMMAASTSGEGPKYLSDAQGGQGMYAHVHITACIHTTVYILHRHSTIGLKKTHVVHIYIYIYIYIYIHVYIYKYVCMYVSMYTYAHL